MASSFLKKKAQERREIIDKTWGADAYNGANQRKEEEQKTSGGSNAAGGNLPVEESTSGKASSYLREKAQKRREVTRQNTPTTSRNNEPSKTEAKPGHKSLKENEAGARAQIAQYAERRRAEGQGDLFAQVGGTVDYHLGNIKDFLFGNEYAKETEQINDEAKRLYGALTSADAPLSLKGESGKSVIDSLSDSKKALDGMEQRLGQMMEEYKRNPSEALAAQYDQLAAQYNQAVAEHNKAYAQYEPQLKAYNDALNAYNAYVTQYGDRISVPMEDEYSPYREQLDALESEITRLGNRKAEINSALGGLSRAGQYGGAGYLESKRKELTDELADINVQTAALEAKRNELVKAGGYLSDDDILGGLAYGGERFLAGALGMGENITDFVGTNLYGLIEGVTSLGGYAPNPVSKWAGDAYDSFAGNSITADYEESIRQRYKPTPKDEELTGFMQTVEQVALPIAAGYGVGKLAGMGSGATTGSLAAPNTATIAANATKGVFGASAAGGATREAHAAGASHAESLTYGWLVGAMEMSVEELSGAIPGLPDGSKMANVVKKVFSDPRVHAVVSHPAVQRLLGGVGEGAEEALSAIFTPYIQRATYDPNAPLATAEDIGEQALLGGLASLCIGAGIDIPAYVAESIYARNRLAVDEFDAETIQGILDTGLESPTDTNSYKIAAELKQKLDAGKDLTASEVMDLYRENVKQVNAENAEQGADEAIMDAARESVGVETISGDAVQGVQEVSRENDTQPVQSENAVEAAQNAARTMTMEKWTGYGEHGTKTFTDLVEEMNADPMKVRKSFQAAYEAGLANVPRSKINLLDTVQATAYNAGQMDKIALDAKDRKAGKVTVREDAGFVYDTLPADVTPMQAKAVDMLAKATGVRVQIAKGLKGNAEIRDDGTVLIAEDFEREVKGKKRSIVFYAAHEIGMHRLMQLAPKEGRAFINALIADKNSALPYGAHTDTELKQSNYAQQNVSLTIDKAMEEVSADAVLGLYEDEEAFFAAIDRIMNGTNEQAKKGARTFKQWLDDTVRKLKQIVAKLSGKERTQVQETLNEVTALRDLYERAMTAAVDRAKAQGATKNAAQTDGGEVLHALKRISGLTETDVRNLLEHCVNGAYADKSYIPMRRNTPGILISEVSRHSEGRVAVENLPIIMEVGKVRQAMEEDIGSGHGGTRQHGISVNGMISIILGMDDPAYIVYQENGRYTEIVRYFDDGGKAALAALDFSNLKNPAYMNGYEGGLFNVMVTAFNPDNLKGYLTNGRNEVIYDKKKDAPQRGSGSKLPSHLNGTPFNDSVAQVEVSVKDEAVEMSDLDVQHSLRTKEPPKNVGIAYKVFFAKNGQLYPPMVANPGGEGTPVGVWLDADVGVAAEPSKTGRPQVKAGGKGTQGGGGSLAFRPGWHLGDLPMATQFARKNPETGAKDLFPADFVWAECEYAMDHDYQEEAMSYGYTENGKFRHSYAGLPRLPEDGYYRYRTNPNPDTVPWVITGAMRVKRILTDAETDNILRDAGVEPMKRQGGPINLEKLGLKEGMQYSLKDSEGHDLTQEQAEYFKDSKVRDSKGNLKIMYHGTDADFTIFDRGKLKDGLGFFFTEDKREAADYGTPKGAYLNITKPFDMYGDTPIEDFLGDAPKYLDGHFNYGAAVKGLREAGYDGLYAYSHGTEWYVAFDSNQIKDIDNTNPTSDPDIRFSLKESGITMTEEEYLDLHDVQYNLKAEESHKVALKKSYSAAESVVSRDALMARYEKTLEIWKRIGGELNSKFLEDWNNKTDRVFTIFKAQQGYKYNVELSSMCKKGVPLFEAIDTIVKKEVMRELRLDVLGKAEKEVLYDILKQHNFEIPCAICYVEQARQREGIIIDAFLNGNTEDGKSKLGWNTVLDDIEAEMKANGVEYKFQNVSRSIATEKYTPADIAMDEKTLSAFHAAVQKLANKEIRRYNKEEGKSRRLLKEVTPAAVKECFKGTLPSNLKIFRTLLTEPASRFRIGKDLLYSSMTTMNLSALHNGLYGLFNAQGGVSGYKTKQGTTVYWGELLGKRWNPDTVRKEGGIRQQSNSDFQMFTFLDKAQMYIDHTAKGFYVQEYSKVLAELKLFGLSGAKLNASLIPAVVEYKNADGSVDVERTMLTAGLDEYGNPIYDDIEGVNHAEAFMLLEDPNYSRSLCGICIGYSDKHIEKLLDDSRVQMIIGFHDKTNDPDKRYRGARYAKNYNGLNEAVEDNGAGKTKHIGFNPYLQKAEKLFTRSDITKRFEGTATFGGKQYVANDIPRLAADMYLADCAKKGYRPAYNDFTGHPNYYKLLSDIGLYDSLGQYAPHEKVAYKLPDKVPYLDKSGNKRFMATEEYIKTELQKELAVRDSIAEALADTSENGIIPQFKAAVKEMRGEEQHSLKGEVDMRAEIERIRREGEKTGKTADEIDAEVTDAVWPQYQELVKTFGEMKRGEKPAREIQVPEKSEEDRKVSQTIRTVLEAQVTPESAIPTIEQMITQGDFSYDVITDKAAMDAAKKSIRSNGYGTSLANWLSDVRAGKVSKANTALGWELYNQAATEGDLNTAITVLDEMVKHQRNAAQAVQASRILKKLSPDAQLYSAVKSVQKLEDDLNEKRKPKKKGADKAAKEVGEAKKDAADAAKKAHKGVRGVRKGGGLAIDSNQAGEPFVFEYAQKVGEAVANGLEAGRNRVEKERTFLQQITAELKRFADEKMPKKEGKKSLTAVDLLRSYVQNQTFFADAWQYAQEELRTKYADDPAFNEFLNTGIGVDANANPSNAIFMRALVKAAADSGEGKNVLSRQSALGFTGMANTIADNLIQQTGATGEMADTIRDAAHSYVLSALREGGKADADLVASSVRSAMSDIGIKVSEVVMSGTGDSAKQAIVDNLVGKYGFGLTEATNTAEVVADSFDQMCREFSQRRLEAMFKERKVTRKTIQEKFEQLAKLGAFDIGSAYNQRAAERIFHEGVKITIDEGLARKFLEAKTQEERDSIMADIYRDVGRQMPSTFIDKWNAWRYLSMLGNFRTHGRNLAGNAFFAPIVLAKDMTATGIEAAVNFVTRGKVGRTKAIPSRDLLKAAWADYANVSNEIMAGGKYSDDAVKNQHIEEGRRIFGRAEDARTGVGRFVSNTAGKAVEYARRKNSEALETEDKWFAQPHYAFALAQYCKANGVTADQLRRGKALGNARAYAIKEAQKATYRDTNAFSETISSLGRYNGDNMVKKGLSVVVEGILPFRKTPANILARGVEYSPAGLVKSITWDLVRVKNGDITAAEMIDNFASGFTGTMLLVAGAWLAAQGLIRGRGGDDDDKKKFEEMQGHQAYSLELPDGTSVTLDWLAPECLPFFVGVNLYEMARDNKGKTNLSDILTAVSNVTEPMLEMSCLQSLNDIFESVGYASSNNMDPLPAVLASAATSYLTQAVPTILGQTERSTEGVRMTTYPEKNAFLTTNMQRTLGKISAKTPGWDYQQIPYIDEWGRTESTGNPVANVANNFLNPAYTSQIETSAMEEELARLYDATGEASVLPSRADKYFTVDEERKDLTAQEYVKSATEKGQLSYKVVTALTRSDAYKSMTDFDRVEAVDLAYDYANAVAKTKVSKYVPEGWIAKAIATNKSTGLSPDKYIPLYMAQKGIESLKDSDGDSISNSRGLQVMQLVYNAKGLTTEQRRALFDDFGVGKSIIHYNPTLVNAKLEKMRKKK